jgi:hypothetical protein
MVLQTTIDLFDLTGIEERKLFYDLTEDLDCEFRSK